MKLNYIVCSGRVFQKVCGKVERCSSEIGCWFTLTRSFDVFEDFATKSMAQYVIKTL